MTTGITAISQDSFSRIDTLLTQAREAAGAKRSSLDGAAAPVAQAPVQTAEADQAYSAVMDMLTAPSGDAHRSLDPERVARLLEL